jgi:hypothetical protein
MATQSIKPAIAGGRTLSKMVSGNKGSSGNKQRGRKQMWGQSGGAKVAVGATLRTDRRGIAGKNLRSRIMACGCTVLMLKSQRPGPGDRCLQHS